MFKSRLTSGLAVAALLASAASPAYAQRGYQRGWDHHRHRGGDDSAAVVGAVLGVGILAAILASASSKQRTAPAPRHEDREDLPPPADAPADYRAPSGGAPRAPGTRVDEDLDYGARSDSYESGRDAGDQDAAVDDCALAARDEGTRQGGYAEVREITDVRATSSGWDVSGTINQRANYRAVGQLRDFRCSWQNGQISGVSIR